MGGNALKVETTRLSKSDYNNLVAELLPMVSELFGMEVYVAPSYADKADFGDLDILVKGDIHPKIVDMIKERFNPEEVYANTNVFSFDYNNFQVDFIFIPSEVWEGTKVYYSYNDLGNLIGKIARFKRMKYGHAGLEIECYNDDRNVKYGEILISRDPELTFNLLGFDWNRYQQGFNTLEDVFEFVVSSKYFDPSCFDNEIQRADQRKRDTKRKNYGLFMEYIKDLPRKNITRPTFWETMTELNKALPLKKFKLKYYNLKLAYEQKREVAAKFNGKLLLERYPGLKPGKEFGQLMMNFKNYISERVDDFDDTILNLTTEEVVELFGVYLKKLKRIA